MYDSLLGKLKKSPILGIAKLIDVGKDEDGHRVGHAVETWLPTGSREKT